VHWNNRSKSELFIALHYNHRIVHNTIVGPDEIIRCRYMSFATIEYDANNIVLCLLTAQVNQRVKITYGKYTDCKSDLLSRHGQIK